MNGNPGIIRRTYDYVALFALLNVVAVAGMGAYLLGGGAIDAEKLRRVVMVLRGEDPTPGEQAQAGAVPTGEEASPETARAGTPTGLDELQDELEILRLEAERLKTELDQRLTLNNSILLRVTTQREAFHDEQAASRAKAQVGIERRQEEGFKKQIAIFEALSPKVAVEHLLDLPDVDEAARVLLEMNTRKAKKIVETAKTGEQLQQMQSILQRLRDVAPERSTDFDQDGS